MTAGQIVTSPSGERIVLDEVGHTVLFENARVRVWEVVLEPGESQPWHLHHHPYLVLNLASSPCHMDWLNGDPPRHIEEVEGGVVHRLPSPVHMLTNDGDRTYRSRLVELKDLEKAHAHVVEPGDPVPSGDFVLITLPGGDVSYRPAELRSGCLIELS